MYGCIKMGAGMFTAGKIVPVPARAAFVITRHFFYSERPALPHFRWQNDLRKFRFQGLCEINHSDTTIGQRRGQRRQKMLVPVCPCCLWVPVSWR